MRRVLVVGVGAGDERQITIEAIDALGQADVLFELARATEDLTAARRRLVSRYVGDGRTPRVAVVDEPRRDRGAAAYGEAVQEWRSRRADAWEAAIRDELAEDGCGAFLVWGDPSLYDSTIAVLDELRERGRVAFEYDVIPGVSSVHALTAAFRIPLNRVGAPVLITTGRWLAEHGWPAGVDDVVVMLDRGGSFRRVLDEDAVEIYWGAYLGTPDEILVSGRLREVADEIERVRERARAQHGWIMDTYLLRRQA